VNSVAMTQPPHILVILPALNEAENITRTIRNIQAHVPGADVLVVDDGSTDQTGPLAQAAGALVLTMPYNVGIGAAVQTAFKFANRHGYDVVVRNDGDGQHGSDGIQRLLDALHQTGVDVVIGSRFIGGGDYGTPFSRRLGILILARLLSLITGQTVTDPTSGFAAFNRQAIRLFARDYPHDYPEPEAIVVLHRSGLTMCEVPVQMHARTAGRSSITATRSAYYMVKVILAILISMLRRAPAIDS